MANKQIANNLAFWIENSSWSYCAKCSSVHKRKLFQRHANHPINTHESACSCNGNRYIVPLFALIPDCLKRLTFSEVCALRPLHFHYGNISECSTATNKKTVCSTSLGRMSALRQVLLHWKIDSRDVDVGKRTSF